MSTRRIYEHLNWDYQKAFTADDLTKEKAHQQEVNEDVPEDELRRKAERGQCPFCGIYRLIWDEGRELYECLNCGKMFKCDYRRVFTMCNAKHGRQKPYIQKSLV